MECVRLAVFLLALLAIPLYAAYGADYTILTGQDADSKITIETDGDRLVTYSMSIATGSGTTLVEPGDPRMEVRDYGFFIVDRTSGFLAVVKDTGSGYVISVKIGPDVKKYSADISIEGLLSPDPGRPKTDAGTGTDAGAPDPRPAESVEETAKRLLAENLKKLEKQNALSKSDRTNIDLTYEEYKKLYYDRDDAKIPPPAETVEEKPPAIKLFVSVPREVRWTDELRYNVLVTDDAKVKHRSEFGSFVGSGIGGVAIDVEVKNTEGETVHKISGSTADDGSWLGTGYVIPDNAASHKPYVVEVTVTHKAGDLTLKEKKERPFYAVAIANPNTNYPPIAHVELSFFFQNTGDETTPTGQNPSTFKLLFEPETCVLLKDIRNLFKGAGNSGDFRLKSSDGNGDCYSLGGDSGTLTDRGYMDYKIMSKKGPFKFVLNDDGIGIDDIVNMTGDAIFDKGVQSVDLNAYKHIVWSHYADEDLTELSVIPTTGNAPSRDLVELMVSSGTIVRNDTGEFISDVTDVNDLFPRDTEIEFAFPAVEIDLDGSKSYDPNGNMLPTFKWKVTETDAPLVKLDPENYLKGEYSEECKGSSLGCEYIVKAANVPDDEDPMILLVDISRQSSRTCFELVVNDGSRNSQPFETCVTLEPQTDT
ncbi:MAG: hypothetical protein EB829_06085 [Nitrosopumilus sp. H8]|nr:MAG: hypothetical protein EB829_06085 [Nitrosopumilus sp. H8]